MSEFETDLMDKAVCPHCGNADEDTWELCGYEFDDETVTCGSCGAEYSLSVSISVYYTTKKIKE